MSLLGFSISSPIFLLSLPLGLGLLVYVYRKRGRGKPILVATNFLLSKLPKEARSKSTFFPPPRFFLELILVIILASLLAGLSTHNQSKNIAILVDNSFHLNAKIDGVTKIDSIVSKVRNTITSLDSDAIVTLFTSSPSTSSVAKAMSTDVAWDAVENIKALPASGDLNQSVEFISKQEAFEAVYIFSDAALPANYKPLKSTYYFPVGTEPVDNIAITELNWLPGDNSTSFGTLKISLASFSSIPTNLEIRIQCITDVAENSVDIASNKIQIDPGVTISQDFQVETPTRACKADILLNDSLIEDNSQWVVTDSNQKDILLVSQFSVRDLKLDAISKYSFLHSSQLEYTNIKSKDFKTVIFHRYSPKEPPLDVNSLYIAPENKLPALETSLSKDLTFSRWKQGHPLIRYMNFPSVNLTKAQSFIPTVDLYPVIFANQGALLLASEGTGVRSVVSGFELLPFEGKGDATNSILLLNILKWLSAGKENDSQRSPFENISVANTDASGYFPNLNKDITAKLTVQLEQTGLFVKEKNGDREYVAVNYYDPQESDLRTTEIYQPVAFNPSKSATEENELTFWLLVGAIALLMLDTLFNFLTLKREIL